ncbi:PD-(D/E)XK nuclease superfamily protein [Arthrobacter subterraneus]|uniref:PD-(D/E)XK nuclease superfamily protein n=1 Tax=Arthrobacter subterraneus TaxID=335973 RepID=A0A1G8H0E5_9MICC|nr:PD-(D/E)XK nuclease family protein [Arthrobacter subterraneus]SDH99960.1 PD-(D/E)XK nuclease superfamily protein [Arthrobacter subterraneus]
MTIQTTGSVSEALGLLETRIAEAKAADPLAPITIIVPSHAAGLDVTRYLGRTLNSGAGSVGVRAFTLKDLATELVAADPSLIERSPLTPSIRQAAISRALSEAPGDFEQVADQPATARAITRTAPLLDSIATHHDADMPGLVREVLRIHRTAMAGLEDRWFTDHYMFECAGRRLRDPGTARRLGTLIGFMLGAQLQPAVAAFRRQVEEAGLHHIQATGTFNENTSLLSASDADDEVRTVVRLVIERLRAGVPGHRIGVFHSTAHPYRALLTQRLDQAGITFVGPAAQRLADAPLARGLLQLLTLDPDEPDVRTILNVLAEGTLVWHGHDLPSSTVCERLHTNPPSEEDDDDEPDERLAAKLEQLALFRTFVDALGAGVRRVSEAASWRTARLALGALLSDFMGPRSTNELPAKAAARAALLDIIHSLGNLDGIGPAPRPAFIRSTLEDNITAKGGWTGKSGTGVVIGGYADAVARDLDAVFLIGAAEGLAPARIRENPLLPDSVSEAIGGDLLTVDQRARVAKDQFLSALAAGRLRVILTPRGDLRGSGDKLPSRWLPPEPTSMKSFAYGIEHGSPTIASAGSSAVAATGQEWRLRHLLTPGHGIRALGEDDVLHRAVTATRDRRTGVFSRYTGNLSAYAGEIIEESKALSPTRLEDWVHSPFSFYLKHVLKVSIFEDVELEVQINAMQRGNLVHKVMEDYVREITVQQRGRSLDRLMELAEAAFAEFANPAWLPHVWEQNQARLRQDFRRLFEKDGETALDGWDYRDAEAPFGMDEVTLPVELELEDGTVFRFRGKVDRIDLHRDGRIRVVDYKTGKLDKYKDLRKHPTAYGTKFQLPVYGLFARSLAEHTSADVKASYWFTSRAGNFEEIGYSVTEEVVDQLRKDAGLIISAIRDGVFPSKPEPEQHITRDRTAVTFTSLAGQLGMDQHWVELQNAPELVRYAQLLKGEK